MAASPKNATTSAKKQPRVEVTSARGSERQSGNFAIEPAKGKLGVTMRLYAPKAQILDGRWNPPAIKQVGVAAEALPAA